MPELERLVHALQCPHAQNIMSPPSLDQFHHFRSLILRIVANHPALKEVVLLLNNEFMLH